MSEDSPWLADSQQGGKKKITHLKCIVSRRNQDSEETSEQPEGSGSGLRWLLALEVTLQGEVWLALPKHSALRMALSLGVLRLY